jgi:hypothetical protein
MSTENVQEIEPIIIRGHHLDILEKILIINHRLSQKDKERIIYNANSDLMNGIEFYYEKSPDGASYKKDVIGTTQEEENKFISDYQQFLLKILSLPDEYPIKIVTGKPDDICKLCAIGKHCRESDGSTDQKVAIWFFGKDAKGEFTTSMGKLRRLFSENDYIESF